MVFRLWTDEKGSPSSARVLLWCWLVLVAYVLVRHLNGRDVDNAVWTILTTIALALIGWAAGPRLAQYLFPSIGTVASAIGQAAKRPFGPREKDVSGV